MFCLIFSSFLYSESLRIVLWLKEQQIPEAVRIGLNNFEQSSSLPYSEHFCRRKIFVFELLKHGKFEFQRRLKRLVKFFPISSIGKVLLVIFLMTASIRSRLALFVLFRKISKVGRLVSTSDLLRPISEFSSQVGFLEKDSALREH